MLRNKFISKPLLRKLIGLEEKTACQRAACNEKYSVQSSTTTLLGQDLNLDFVVK